MMRSNKGFTIVELMLSMTFVSLLLIAVAVLTMHLSGIYTKGITMRQVNTAGQELVNGLQRSVQAAQQINIDEDFVVFMSTGDPVRRGGDAYTAAATDTEHVIGGRLCLQGKSYAWNTGRYLTEDLGGSSPNTIDGTPVHLVQASNDDICAGEDLGDFEGEIDASATELLRTGDRELAVHKFYISGNPQRGLYAISFTIGTNRQGSLTSDNSSCVPPSNEEADSDYCTVNRFDIVTRTIPDKTEEEAP